MEWLPIHDFEDMIARADLDRQKHELRMEVLEMFRKGKVGKEDAPKYRAFFQDPKLSLPNIVATALNIYFHEELRKLDWLDPWKEEDWASGEARKVAEGALDRKKQSALYVAISKTGEVGQHPGLITRKEASEAIERAKRFSEGPAKYSDEYRTLKKLLAKVLFETPEDPDQYYVFSSGEGGK